MIKFEDVSYTYQRKTPYEYQALNQITTEFLPGRYYAIIGQTGSGKSTLIQHFNGLLKPSRGKMQLFDVEVDRKTKDKLLKPIRQRVGMVFQFPESQLFEETVEKEILFGPNNYGMNLESAKDKARQLLSELGFDVDQIMGQSPFQLSGGQMRKIALTAILAMDPDILVLDEPTAGLDPRSKKQVMTLFKKLQQEAEKTIILVTHDMNDVAAYADEIKIMQKGTLIESTTPADFFQRPEDVRALHLCLPHVVRLQRDVEARLGIQFGTLALTEEDFVTMYEGWRQRHER
ncbi:energy-coupling factor transporter ATPase [Staphylococcus lutrae]|uniref:Energy-coupling factor transporter ATP-binding protein EcfA2 n=1 Tax=Staphylococcus lutrae TaxID=155085 RepID=A0AAC9RV80_9STAP|nr:energy-coupling factor transporter ATPase [Staphylococcus lutrae]ARJ50377.1 energy-coupling factor transporter ATPase [Staphylococcus lutrae]PNZ38723.1 energy-coupling factor transporter ATPase [Staphylococcus lutrae]